MVLVNDFIVLNLRYVIFGLEHDQELTLLRRVSQCVCQFCLGFVFDPLIDLILVLVAELALERRLGRVLLGVLLLELLNN